MVPKNPHERSLATWSYPTAVVSRGVNMSWIKALITLPVVSRGVQKILAPRRQSPIRLHFFFQLSKLEFQFVELAQLLMAMRASASERMSLQGWSAIVQLRRTRQTPRRISRRRGGRSSRGRAAA